MEKSPHGLNYSAHRPVVMSRRGVVSSAHYLASQAGLRMLMAGGNAVDAIVATAATLNVVEPQMSGLGGDGFSLVYHAPSKKLEALNATGAAPLAATIDRFKEGGIPARYGAADQAVLRISTPGLLDGWLTAHGRYGSLPWREVLTPAIELASEGLPVSHKLSEAIKREKRLLAAHQRTADTFMPGGRPPEPGELLVQADLARTLEAIAADGRGPFYEGPVGRAIVTACQELGGLFTDEDFAGHRCVGWSEPLMTTYRGYEVYEHPPNSSGLALLEMLNILERFDVASMGHNSTEAVHLMAEVKKLAFADREYIGDPAWVQVPEAELLSKDYASQRAGLIDMSRASTGVAGGLVPSPAGHTTYLCAVDRWGNAVSHIQSHGSEFGSGIVAGDTGVLLNDRMHQWRLEPDHANALMPGKRVRHTMNPPMAFKDGKLFLLFGTPGGDTQVQTNMQVLSNIVDFGMTPQEAVEAARWHHNQRGTQSDTHLSSAPDGDRLTIEDRYPPAVLDGLRDKGHTLEVLPGWAEWGSAQAILVEPETGTMMGAADPRRDAYAAGW